MDYPVTRDGRQLFFLDTIGLHDNRQDLNLSDDQILKKLESHLGFYDSSVKIVFLLVQALSERRFNLHMESQKYRGIFGPSFLKSSIVVATGLDLVPDGQRDAAA